MLKDSQAVAPFYYDFIKLWAVVPLMVGKSPGSLQGILYSIGCLSDFFHCAMSDQSWSN